MAYNPNYPQHNPGVTGLPGLGNQPHGNYQPPSHQPAPVYDSRFHPQPSSQYGRPSSQPSSAPGTPRASGIPQNEPPLMEELGIDFEHIFNKTRFMMDPFYRRSLTKTIGSASTNDLRSILSGDAALILDSDLGGPLLFGVILAFSMILGRKTHFGSLYGIGVVGSLSIWIILTLMSRADPLELDQTISILGYSLIPIVILSIISILFTLTGPIGLTLAFIFVSYSTYTASSIFIPLLALHQQQYLVAYPIFLHYACFALVTIY